MHTRSTMHGPLQGVPYTLPQGARHVHPQEGTALASLHACSTLHSSFHFVLHVAPHVRTSHERLSSLIYKIIFRSRVRSNKEEQERTRRRSPENERKSLKRFRLSFSASIQRSQFQTKEEIQRSKNYCASGTPSFTLVRA